MYVETVARPLFDIRMCFHRARVVRTGFWAFTLLSNKRQAGQEIVVHCCKNSSSTILNLSEPIKKICGRLSLNTCVIPYLFTC